MLYNDVLEAIGNTPLIRLNKLSEPDSADVYVKFEALNIGGSIKTRTAFNMLEQARCKGLVDADTIIIEPTSGNQGIGIALVGAVMGYQVIIVMPDSVSEERRKLISQYGAQLILIHDEGNIGACIEQCMATTLELQQRYPKTFLPQQFDNPDNPAIHRQQTAQEILNDLGSVPIHGFCAGVGTGGTLTGIGEALREAYPDIEIWAVEPEHAAILSGHPIGSHLQMGIGDGLIPNNLNQEVYQAVQIITDEEAIATAKALAREEGLLCGISSGSNVAAALQLARKLGKGKVVVTLLPDTGERYFSTALFD